MKFGALAAVALSTWIASHTTLPGTAGQTPADYSGTWRGRFLSRNRDSVLVNWTWVHGRDGTGSITFADEMSAIPTRQIAGKGDSVDFELLQPLEGPDSVRLRFMGRLSGDSLAGTALVTTRNGQTGRRPFQATRVGPVPAFEKKECAFSATPGNIECGWLTVPESRNRPLGRTVRLNVVVARPANTSGAPPVVFLSGGPGQSGAPVRWNPGLIATARDLIYFDQRGTGTSQPALCPEFSDDYSDTRNSNAPENWGERMRPLIRRCVESLRAQGIDAETYNTTTSAQDVADLRRALGYEKWIVRGGSYGTRLAQEIMRTDPLGVHAAVMIAPAPAGRQGEALEWRLSIQHTLERLFAACTADPACHTAFPDPEADFYALWESLNREPIHTVAANGQDTVVLRGDRLVNSLVRLFDGGTFHARIPFLLHELRRGDRVRAARELAPNVANNSGVAVALNRLVNCYESSGLRQGVVDSVNTVPKPPFRMKLDAEACTLWRSRFASDAENAPVRSDIPTLIITGEYDMRTTAEDAHRIARTLSHAYVYVLPGMGHSGLGPCGLDLVRQFVENSSRPPDASCLTRMPKLSFATAWPVARP
jgi:pimeloyl-ACP methyl ester carboxylesterase